MKKTIEVVNSIIRVFAHPYSIIAVWVICLVGALFVNVDDITYGLSVVSITATQLVLLLQLGQQSKAQARDDAMHATLNALVEAIPGAPNELAGNEKECE